MASSRTANLSALGHKFDDVFARLHIVLVLVVVPVLEKRAEDDYEDDDEDDSQMNVIVFAVLCA